MNIPPSLLDGLRPNPEWAKLPIFDRKGWKRVPFGAFADNINKRVEPADAADEIYVGLDDLDPGSLHIRRCGKGSDVIGTKLRFRKGDIIFGRRRAYQRKLAVAEIDGICSAHAMVVRAERDVVLPEFLPFLMMSDRFMNRAVEISVGSLSPTINWTTLRHEEFDLPPVEQQRRIAEMLWAIDTASEIQRSLHLDYSRLYESVIWDRTVNAKNLTIGPLEQFAEFITDGDHNPPKRHESGVPHVVVRNIEQGRLNLEGCTYVSSDDFERVKKRYAPRENDIILTCVGTIGRICLVPKQFMFSADRSLALIRTSETLLPEFAQTLLRSETLQKEMAASAIGTAQKHLFLKDIRSLRVAVPKVTEQKKILSAIIPIAHAQELVELALKSTKQIQAEILHSLFRGSDV